MYGARLWWPSPGVPGNVADPAAAASPSRVVAGALPVMRDTVQAQVAACTAAWPGTEAESR